MGAASPPDDDLQPEYDFRLLRGVLRGKYAPRYGKGSRAVRLAADVASQFSDEESVNQALREYLREPRVEQGPP